MKVKRKLEMCNASVLNPTDYEQIKRSSRPECERYRYCRRNGLRQDISPEDLLQYIDTYDKSTHLFETMVFDRKHDDLYRAVEIHVFKDLINCYGWESIRDTRVFSEKNKDKVNFEKLEKLMREVSNMPKLSKALEINRAKGDVYAWSKYAINKLGKMLGLCDRRTKIMTGEKGYRVWRLRGGGEPNLYQRQLELTYMRNFRYVSRLNPLEIGFNGHYLADRSTILYKWMDIDRLIIMCMIHSLNISTCGNKSPNKRERTKQQQIRNLHFKTLLTLFSQEEISKCINHIKEFATEDVDYHGVYSVDDKMWW